MNETVIPVNNGDQSSKKQHNLPLFLQQQLASSSVRRSMKKLHSFRVHLMTPCRLIFTTSSRDELTPTLTNEKSSHSMGGQAKNPWICDGSDYLYWIGRWDGF